jgi:hypothetical protein
MVGEEKVSQIDLGNLEIVVADVVVIDVVVIAAASFVIVGSAATASNHHLSLHQNLSLCFRLPYLDLPY